jgi:hypothetical protein
MNLSITASTQNEAPLYYHQDFINWLRSSILLLPLTMPSHRAVLDACMRPLVECYEKCRRHRKDSQNAVAAFDAEKLIANVRIQVSRCQIKV